VAYQSEKQLRELGDKLSADQKQELEVAIKDVREKLNGNDANAIKQAADDLQSRLQKITAELYKHAASGTNGQTREGAGESSTRRGASSKSGANVVDADFEVVDEEKKKS
jgi:molecular chaperone DnaK